MSAVSRWIILQLIVVILVWRQKTMTKVKNRYGWELNEATKKLTVLLLFTGFHLKWPICVNIGGSRGARPARAPHLPGILVHWRI